MSSHRPATVQAPSNVAPLEFGPDPSPHLPRPAPPCPGPRAPCSRRCSRCRTTWRARRTRPLSGMPPSEAQAAKALNSAAVCAPCLHLHYALGGQRRAAAHFFVPIRYPVGGLVVDLRMPTSGCCSPHHRPSLVCAGTPRMRRRYTAACWTVYRRCAWRPCFCDVLCCQQLMAPPRCAAGCTARKMLVG